MSFVRKLLHAIVPIQDLNSLFAYVGPMNYTTPSLKTDIPNPYLLPPKDEVYGLLDEYFANFYVTFPHIDKDMIYQLYHDAESKNFQYISRPALTLLNMIFAIAWQTSTRSCPQIEKSHQSEVFYLRANALIWHDLSSEVSFVQSMNSIIAKQTTYRTSASATTYVSIPAKHAQYSGLLECTWPCDSSRTGFRSTFVSTAKFSLRESER